MFSSKFGVVLRKFSVPANFLVTLRSFSVKQPARCTILSTGTKEEDCRRQFQKISLCTAPTHFIVLKRLFSNQKSKLTHTTSIVTEPFGKRILKHPIYGKELMGTSGLMRTFSSKQPPKTGCATETKEEDHCERLFKRLQPSKDRKKSYEPKKYSRYSKETGSSKEQPDPCDRNKSQVQQCKTKLTDPPDPCKKQEPCDPLPVARKKEDRAAGPCREETQQRESPMDCPPKEKEDPCKKKPAETSGSKRKGRSSKKDCNIKSFKRKSNIDPNKDGAVCQQGDDDDEMSMCALVFCPENREVRLQQVKIPNHIKKDEVLVQVHYAGVNQTDFAVLDGKIPTNMEILIPGREFSGIVCGVGDKVEHVKAGDTVAVAPCQPSTVCRYCTDDKKDFCVKDGGKDKSLGVNRDGGWAEFSVVQANSVYKVPEGTDPKDAALLPALAQVMCSLSRLKMEPNMEVLILGGGLIGSLMALFLKHNGYEVVTICEDNPQKVRQLECLCTGYPIISPSKIDCMALDIVITNGAGGHVMEKALNALKSQGQFIILGPVGGNGDTPEMTINCQDFSMKQIRMEGLTGSPSNPSNISPELVCSALKEELAIPIYPMAEYQEALRQVQTGDTGQVLLKVRPERPRCPPTNNKQCAKS